MNIAAEELGRDIAFWEASEPSESARVWCTLLLKEEKELYFFFLSFLFFFWVFLLFLLLLLLQALQYPQFFWGEEVKTRSLFGQIYFFLVVVVGLSFCFLVCLFILSSFFFPFQSGVWIRCYIANKEFGEILKVTSLSTFNGEL